MKKNSNEHLHAKNDAFKRMCENISSVLVVLKMKKLAEKKQHFTACKHMS